MNRIFSAAGAMALTLGLAACGGDTTSVANHGDDPLPNGMTVKEQIEARQQNLKDLGGAFKTVNDQLKTSEPQLEQIRVAVQEIRGHAQEIGNWFPEATGPESGVETEALPVIWTDAAGFSAAAQKLATEAAALNDAAVGGDIAAIQAQVRATGGACKNCHDTFRLQKD